MTYRDDLEAAKMRRGALAHELRGVRKQMDELQALGQRAHHLENELDRVATDLDRARSKVALPMLSQVRVASPCSERWDDMNGDERVRHCGHCDKNVYDLSALTSKQAESLLQAHGASLCVRFYRRNDGTVMTSDCPVGRGKRRLRRGALAAVAASLLAAGGFSAAFFSHPPVVMGQIVVHEDVIMGKVEMGAHVESGQSAASEIPEAPDELECDGRYVSAPTDEP